MYFKFLPTIFTLIEEITVDPLCSLCLYGFNSPWVT